MFNAIIRFSLTHRLIILIVAFLLVLVGLREMSRLPVDVLPDLNRPRVTVMTECEGMAPEEVEILVTTPLEESVTGATGVIAVRSNSTVGLSIITVEFDWNTDPYRCRQIVSERLALANERLPEGVSPQMTPISSVMGQVLMLGMWSDDPDLSPLELRTIADWVVRKRLLSISGVAEVFTVGGGRKQFQVLVRTEDLLKYGVWLHDVETALKQSNRNVTGGYLTSQGDDQYLVRSLGRIRDVKDLEELVVSPRPGRSVCLGQVATVVEAPAVPTGNASAYQRTAEDGSMSGGPAVILTIGKQPGTDTLRLTEEVLKTVEELQRSLQKTYPGLRIEPLYQQREFIDLAIANVIEALWIGAILVAIALAMFLMNLRTTVITLVAMPMSIIMACLIFAWWGLSINTMTLGGLAVAIGELVDDAIVDVENIFRRLRENCQREKPLPAFRVVYDASREIRNSIVNGTLIVVLVFLPLFFLTGIEGKLFRPLGIAYVVSILSSLVVSLTLTPVLAYLLLPQIAHRHSHREGFVMRFAKGIAGTLIRASLAFPRTVLASAVVAVIVAAVVFFSLERNFMPAFNEGAIQLNVDLMPGRSLDTSSALADRLAQQIAEVEGVRSVARKTGRAELDEHAVPVNTSELICSLDTESGRDYEEILADLEKLIDRENIPGTIAFSDQPLQHLINHLRAGTRAQIAVKLRGNDLGKLRKRANRIKDLIDDIRGIGTVRIDPIQVDVKQVRITLDRTRLQTYGLTPDQVNEMVETAMNGRVITEVVDGRRFFEVLLRLDAVHREDLGALQQLPIRLPDGGIITLKDVATIDPQATGPHQIDHEAARRQVLIQSNPTNRGAVDVKNDIEKQLRPHWQELTDRRSSSGCSRSFHSWASSSFSTTCSARRRCRCR
jgi:HME family heavy-metal exporter